MQRYAEIWLGARTTGTKVDDAARLRDQIFPRLGALRLSKIDQEHIVRLVADLHADASIAQNTPKNACGAFRTMLRDAMIAKLIPGGDPCMLPKGSWRKQAAVERESYTAAEVLRFVTDERSDWDRRVLFAELDLPGCSLADVPGSIGPAETTKLPLAVVTLISFVQLISPISASTRPEPTRRQRANPASPT
ncbi:MAG TPA: hypothetical protein VJU61_02630, partial [Polyangiaceae bacterium]|nr:hypothetical protein [Polyangiaceae bacterium]